MKTKTGKFCSQSSGCTRKEMNIFFRLSICIFQILGLVGFLLVGTPAKSSPFEESPVSLTVSKTEEAGKEVSASPSRLPLPGDNVIPPSGGVKILVSSLKSKFGIAFQNGTENWGEGDLNASYRVMSSLPNGFRKCTTAVQLEFMERRKKMSFELNQQYNDAPKGQEPGALAGWVANNEHTIVHLCVPTCYLEHGFQKFLVHEMCHCFQNKNREILNLFENRFWPGGVLKSEPTSLYGVSSPKEDMAESAAEYWANGDKMKLEHPARYRFMQINVFDSVEFLSK